MGIIIIVIIIIILYLSIKAYNTSEKRKIEEERKNRENLDRIEEWLVISIYYKWKMMELEIDEAEAEHFRTIIWEYITERDYHKTNLEYEEILNTWENTAIKIIGFWRKEYESYSDEEKIKEDTIKPNFDEKFLKEIDTSDFDFDKTHKKMRNDWMNQNPLRNY